MTEETEETEKKEYKVVEVTTETGLAVSSQEGKVISQLDLFSKWIPKLFFFYFV